MGIESGALRTLLVALFGQLNEGGALEDTDKIVLRSQGDSSALTMDLATHATYMLKKLGISVTDGVLSYTDLSTGKTVTEDLNGKTPDFKCDSTAMYYSVDGGTTWKQLCLLSEISVDLSDLEQSYKDMTDKLQAKVDAMENCTFEDGDLCLDW